MEKVRKVGVRIRGREGGREGNKERGGMEDVFISFVPLRLYIFLLYNPLLSFLTSFPPQLFFTFPLSFLRFFSLCFLYFSVFLSFLTSSFYPSLLFLSFFPSSFHLSPLLPSSLTSRPLLVFPPHFCLPVLPPSSSSSPH